jgi:hypothetical protein
MEAIVRKPFQGVLNILRFNWHFYILAFSVIVSLFILAGVLSKVPFWLCIVFVSGISLSLLASLAVSYYVYDYSPLYQLEWLMKLGQEPASIINIHAGFDETSATLAARFPDAKLTVFDFYDPEKHTEISISRARQAYPEYAHTIHITTEQIPVQEQSVDLFINIFSLHEIRDRNERINFLRQQRSALSENGSCIVVEHLRDVPNFIAYNIGFFHFYPKSEWKKTFTGAGFKIENTIRVTPFVKVFILKK